MAADKAAGLNRTTSTFSMGFRKRLYRTDDINSHSITLMSVIYLPLALPGALIPFGYPGTPTTDIAAGRSRIKGMLEFLRLFVSFMWNLAPGSV